MKKCFSLLLIFCLVILLCGCHLYDSEQDSSFYWLPEESSFVDYNISGDRIRFRYSICFVNERQQDVHIKLSSKFSGKELSGWVESKDFFEGLDSEGKWSYQTVKAGEKTQLMYTFEGKYLGGEVNTELSFPEDLIVALDGA